MAVPEGCGAAFVFVLSEAGAAMCEQLLRAARLFVVFRRRAAMAFLRDPSQ
jgi:hypothetical protein